MLHERHLRPSSRETTICPPQKQLLLLCLSRTSMTLQIPQEAVGKSQVSSYEKRLLRLSSLQLCNNSHVSFFLSVTPLILVIYPIYDIVDLQRFRLIRDFSSVRFIEASRFKHTTRHDYLRFHDRICFLHSLGLLIRSSANFNQSTGYLRDAR